MALAKIVLVPDLAGRLLELSLQAGAIETGGVLLGRNLSSEVLLITDVIDAGQAATRSQLRFEPDYEWQQAAFESALARDPGLRYLGDWHSHPRGAPVPSATDKHLLTTIAGSAASGPHDPLIIICGGAPVWEARAFTLDNRGRTQQILLVRPGASDAEGKIKPVREGLGLLMYPRSPH